MNEIPYKYFYSSVECDIIQSDSSPARGDHVGFVFDAPLPNKHFCLASLRQHPFTNIRTTT